ncbi:MAG: AI-2E family transporter [Xanthobacteraceae bacterium]|nr:AI-2E family transporter [Xanthobacteraceae bacterium]
MNLQRQVIFWLGALVAFILVLWILREMLLPFVAGMALAYLLNPLTDRLERYGVNRMIATLAVVGFFLLVFVVVAILLVPLLGSQLFAFIQRLPGYVTRLQEVLMTEENKQWLQRLIGDRLPDMQKSVGDLVGQGASWIGGFLVSLWSGGRAIISVFALVIITPVVAFYVLYDWHKMVQKVDSWLPLRYRETIRRLAGEIDQAVAGFLRGQASVCLILGFYYAAALTLTGLNFGLLIGFSAGLLTFIPYVGSLSGLVIATIVAFAQFWPDWTWVVVVACIFFAGQFIEGYILSPKLVGERVGLHPVWLMFSLFAFGYLLGFVGLLLAVPLAAATGVLVRFALSQYLASPLYTGEPRRSDVGKTGIR